MLTGYPEKDAVLNQVCANVLNRPILVPEGDMPGLGSAIFAFLIVGTFRSIEEVQDRLCTSYRTFEPAESRRSVYDNLFWHFRQIYFSFGTKDSAPVQFGRLLPALQSVASTARCSDDWSIQRARSRNVSVSSVRDATCGSLQFMKSPVAPILLQTWSQKHLSDRSYNSMYLTHLSEEPTPKNQL